jgi:hypothetical protein
MVLNEIGQNPRKVAYLVKLLFPVGYLSLLAPHVLLLTAPSLAINLLSANYQMHALDMFHYSAAIVPFVVVSAAWGVAWLAQLAHRLLKVKKWFVMAVLSACILLLSGFYHRLLGYSPLGQNFRWLQITDHHRLGERLARSIPREAIVSAQNHLNPHLSQRETIYVFPNVHDAEYIFVDVTGPTGPYASNEEYQVSVKQMIADTRFGALVSQDGYILFQRGAAPKPLDRAFYSFLLADAVEGALLSVRFGELRLGGARVALSPGNRLEVHSYWQAQKLLRGDLRLFVCLVDQGGDPLPGTSQELRASVWYPPQRWEVEQLVHDKAVFQLPVSVDVSTAAVGFFAGPLAAVQDARARVPVVVDAVDGVDAEARNSILVVSHLGEQRWR